jgi:transcriptional regulator with XRE-family HTH domain
MASGMCQQIVDADAFLCLQFINTLLDSTPMTMAYAPPKPFLRRLKQAFAGQSLSLREIARRTEMSPAYLSCLLKGQRNAPDNGMIAKLEDVLDIQPRGSLFDAAGRHDTVATKVFKDEGARRFLSSLELLPDEQRAKVLEQAILLAKKYHPEKYDHAK